MRPTRLTLLLTLALATAVSTWAVVRMIDVRGGVVDVLPWTVPAAVAFLAFVVLMLALSLRRRLAGGPGVRPVHPIGAARLVAVAKAASHAGAVLTGLYAGLTVFGLRDLEMAPAGRWVVSAVSTGAAVAVVAAGLFLERVCRVEPPEDEQPVIPGP